MADIVDELMTAARMRHCSAVKSSAICTAIGEIKKLRETLATADGLCARLGSMWADSLSSRDAEIERLRAALTKINEAAEKGKPTEKILNWIGHIADDAVNGRAVDEQSTPQSFAEAKRERDDGWIK